ncbi:hypothetical protein MXD81_50295 [Microbacteriaceae bacterium K1510]|nr:hypothetical protein [Microbacteriaceae bacterium K1510]
MAKKPSLIQRAKAMKAGRVILFIGLAVAGYAFLSPGKPSAPPAPSPKPDFSRYAVVEPPRPLPETTVDVPLPRARPSLPQAQVTRREKTAETILTAAAIAALIVQASRQSYYATGRSCACPDDTTRNGRRCGGRSAYSRPGGAQPLCYPTDVTPAMIEAHRARMKDTDKVRLAR